MYKIMHNIDRMFKGNRFKIIQNIVRGHCFKYFKEIQGNSQGKTFSSIGWQMIGIFCLTILLMHLQSTLLKQVLIAGCATINHISYHSVSCQHTHWFASTSLNNTAPTTTISK